MPAGWCQAAQMSLAMWQIFAISSISPRLGQEGHFIDSSDVTSSHPEPISSLLDRNLTWTAFLAVCKAFWACGSLTWLILGTADPWALLACTLHSPLPTDYCHSGQSNMNQSWDSCGTSHIKEKFSFVSLIGWKPGFFGGSTWECAENEPNRGN